MVANKVEKLLVTNGTQGATVAAATAGQYVALVQGKANNTPIVKGDKFQLAIKKLNGELQFTDVIKADDIVDVRLEEYRAPVAQVATITVPTPVVDNEYTVVIVDKADKEIFQRRQDKHTFTVKAVTGETASTLAAKFRALINDSEAVTVTAGGTAAALTLTGKTDGVDATGRAGLQHYFEAFFSTTDALGNQTRAAATVATTAVDFGNGTYLQVKEIERYAQGYEGYLNRTKFPVELYPSDLSATATYDLIVISYDNNHWSNSVVSGKYDSPIEIVIAVTAGATTALEALLANFIVD